MFRRFTKKRALVVLSVVAALVIAGAAIAYFTSSGSGTGNATVGSSTNWTITPAAATGAMYPGSGSSTFTYTVDNPGSGPQHLNSTSATVAHDGSGNILEHGTAVSGCLASWFSATDTSPAPAEVAAGHSVSGSVSVSMSDAGVSQDPCQGHTPDISLGAN